jgi:tRNA modification GTPase
MCRRGSIWATGNLIEAEAIDALARAKTERAVRFLCQQRRRLASTLTEAASCCDSSPATARASLESMVAGFEMAQRMLDGTTVVLLGPPNSGKSTLFNQLVGRSAVIVSSQAGTTRDWVAESIELAGVPVMLVDTAGLSETPDLSERRAVEAGCGIGKTADLCLLVFDGSRPVPPATESFRRASASARRRLVVANKLDLGRAWNESAALGEHGHPVGGLIRISATQGAGLGQLVEQIASLLGVGPRPESEPCFFAERQVQLATEALSELRQRPAVAALIIEEQLIGTRSVTGD